MNCPKCKSSSHKKNGMAAGRQRYKCHDCGYNYSVQLKSTASPDSVKRQALQLYLEGLGFRSIGRFLGVSHVSVYNWIKKFGQELEGKKFIDYSFANRGTETGQKLWKKIKNKDIGEVMTDHWKAYAEFIPKNIHTRSKAETYTVEGYNSHSAGIIPI